MCGARLAKFEKLECATEELWLFWCPGCECNHFVRTKGTDGPVWVWNGDVDKPTVTPSLRIRRGEARPLCHLFITDGKIQFLADCTHALAGQTVELEDQDTVS